MTNSISITIIAVVMLPLLHSMIGYKIFSRFMKNEILEDRNFANIETALLTNAIPLFGIFMFFKTASSHLSVDNTFFLTAIAVHLSMGCIISIVTNRIILRQSRGATA